MKKKKIWKDIRKCFSHTKGRFLSIFALMMLGSFALVGLKVTGPDIRETGIHYFRNLNLSDITVIGDYGIDEANQNAINQLADTEEVEYGYLKDVKIKNTTDGIRIFSNPENISKYELTDGRNADEDREIVLSNTYADKYNIGDTIEFAEKEDITGKNVLKRHTFKIVGFAKSPEFLSSINMGQSTSGAGELKGYGFVKSTVFDSDYYMLARITFKDTKYINPYSDGYTDFIQKHKNELEKLLINQPEIRLQTIKAEYQRQIDDGQKQIDEAKQKLSDTEELLANANNQIEEAKINIDSSDIQLQEAQKQLSSGQSQWNEKWIQIQSAKQELDSAKDILAFNENSLTQKTDELEEKQQEYDIAYAAFSQKKEEYENAQEELETKQAELDSAKQNLMNRKSEYESTISSYYQTIDTLNWKLENPDIPIEEKEKLCQALKNAEKELQKLEFEYSIFIDDTYTPQMSKIEAAQQQMIQNRSELESTKIVLDEKEQELNVFGKTLDSAAQEISTVSGQLKSAKQQLSENEKNLNQAKQTILVQKELLEQKGNQYNAGYSKLEAAKKELVEKESEYKNALDEFNEKKEEAETKITENEEKLSDAKESMDRLELPVYALDTRREVPGSEGYKIYDTISTIIDALADVFPIFLYFVAALVTLTTMTRFVDEERVNSGTLKALGYTDRDVMKKFTVYGLISGLSGAITGIIFGHIFIPEIVYNAYGKNFDVPQIELHFYWRTTVVALILAILSVVLPACIVASRELKEKPSALLLPKPPANGSKIFLEHIKPIWNKMSFTHKVTARNIFRYKKRMFMTIFGVCGAVTLLFAGFSVQNSISGINEKQFGEIIKYDLIVAQNQNLTDKKQNEIHTLLTDPAIKQQLPIYYDSVTKVAGKNHDKQEIKLIVTENENKLDDYITLQHRKTQEKINLESKEGAVISERFAKLLDVGIGDRFTISDSNNREYTLKVADITEMYTGHFIFMNDSYYEKSFSEEYKPNANLIILKDHSTENARIQAGKFMESDSVKGVVQNMTLTNQIDTIVHSLNKVMEVLIIVAILLAVVILYNLTNINIAERIRELSTIKVLGFYDREVTMYIYRETILLSFLGILAGFGLGDVLYRYILAVVPPDEVMFNPALGTKAFIVPVVLIAGITAILGCIMNRKLRKLDMLSALKSVE